MPTDTASQPEQAAVAPVPHPAPAPQHPVISDQIASTRSIFFLAGFGSAGWAPLVPYAQDRAAVGDGMLGLLLLSLGLGSLITMPLAGALAARFGCRRVIATSAAVLAAILPLLATVGSVPGLVGVLLIFGAGLGCLDVSMNIQAIIVERASGRTMMSGFHGLFSLGGIAGAGGMTLLLALGVTPLGGMLTFSALIALALVWVTPRLLPTGASREGPAFAWPRGIVLFIGILCFITFLTEGAVLDWSAVFLTGERALAPVYGGLGYAAFAVTMTLGRLTGDRLVERFGGPFIMTLGGACACVGMLLVTFVPSAAVAIAAFALVGAGCSNVVPVLFSSTGRQRVMPESVAVPAITTLGYGGILVGPAGIGAVAHVASLATAFFLIAVLLLAVAFGSRVLRAHGVA